MELASTNRRRGEHYKSPACLLTGKSHVVGRRGHDFPASEFVGGKRVGAMKARSGSERQDRTTSHITIGLLAYYVRVAGTISLTSG
jgi:hypothetical protein